MNGLLGELEDSIVLFVRQRVPLDEWKYLRSRFGIEGRMEDDDVSDLKEYVFDRMLDAVNWNAIVNEIQDMADLAEEEEHCEEEEEDMILEAEDEDETDSD
jgi:hypothetical protein